MAALTLRFLGGFEVARGGEPADGFESDKARGLLAYLAMEAERPQRREVLSGLLWPEMTESAARGNLRRVLANVRDVIGDREAEVPFLIITRQTIQFNKRADVILDTAILEGGVITTPRSSSGTTELETAVAAYQGDFLAGFSVASSAPFEQWLIERRESLRQLALEGLEQLVNRHEAHGDWAAALGSAQRQLAIDPLREEAQRQAMRLLALMGDRSGALAQYEICEFVLEEELGVAPEMATTALYEQIRSGGLVESMPSSWGEALRGYELRERIGSGAFGIVYRAYQPAVDRQVAVKVIRPEFANRSDFIRRFEAEARLVARLDHLHIVPLYDYWREANGAFLVMRWLRAGSLRQALMDGPWPAQRAALLLDQITGALSYAHQRGVVHGDVRAENILLDEAGNAFLSDFGIARDEMQPLPIPQTETISGSVMAISPEQVSGSQASPQSDQYCLGMLLYQVLTGRSPLAGRTPEEQVAAVGNPLPPLHQERPDLPPDLDVILQHATAREPAGRYQEIQNLAVAFREAIGDTKAPSAFYGDCDHDPVNPYKGLRPFLEADAGDFFGREALVRQLLTRMGEANGRPRLLAVVGPSGSGKSSVVNAGLIPALRRGALPGSGLWFVATMTPGRRPLAELEMALRQVAAFWTEETGRELRRDELGLLHVTGQILADKESQLLLVVDQFEELYTHAEDKGEVDRFLRLLAQTACAENGNVRVIITLRADFFDRPLLHPQFCHVLREGTEVVLPLTRDEQLDAVRCPAERVGVRFAPGVTEGIVEEVQKQPGALPIMQYALMELFVEQQNRQISLQAYETIGGVTGALIRRAEAVYAALNEEAHAAARQVFLRLVALGEGGEGTVVPDTRRRVLRIELEELGAVRSEKVGKAAVTDVLQAFGSHRLLTFDRDPRTRTPTVELAHEALLHEWPRLSEWLEESRDAVRLQRRLTAATGEWVAAGRAPGLLASETRLAQYKVLATGDTLALTADEEAYVAASFAAEVAREVEEQRKRKLLRGLGIGASVAAVVAIALALLALNARSSALREAEVNRSMVLAATAEEALQAGETDRALALALEAVSIDDPPADAVSKLATVAYGRGTRAILSGHSAGVHAAAFSPDGVEVLSGSCVPFGEEEQCGAGELIRWNVASGEELARWAGHENGVTAVAWHPNGERALTGGGDGSLIVWNMRDNTAEANLPAHEGAINRIAFSPDGELAALASADGAISLVDATTGAIVRRFVGHEGEVLDVTFSPDGQQLLSGAADSLIILWDVFNGTILQTFEGHGDSVSGVAFVDNGAAVLSGSVDLSFRKWDIATGEQLQRRESGDSIDGMVLSPDGRNIIQNSSYIIYTWDPGQFDGAHEKLLGHDGRIHDLAFSGDGQFALSASEDGTVRVWDLGGSDIKQTQLGFPALGVAVSPDGRMLAINSWDENVELWDVASDRSLRTLRSTVGTMSPNAVDISADGRTVVGASSEYYQGTGKGSVVVWEMATGKVLCDFREHVTHPRTVAFSPDGTTLLSGSMGSKEEGDLILWDGATCNIIRRLPTSHNVASVDFSSDGKYAVSASNTGQMTLWNLAEGKAVRVFEIPGDVLLDGAFGPDDKTVLAGGINGVIVEWDRESGEEINRFVGHDGGAWAIDVSGDGRWLVSSDDTGLVILWDLSSGAEIRQHHAHGRQVFHLLFSPDDETVYSVSNDQTLVAWQVGDPSLEGLLNWIKGNRNVRQLTCEERALYGVKPLCK